MGLTIHYDFSDECSASEMRAKLEKLKRAFEKFPVDVRRLLHYEPGELQNEPGCGLGPKPGEEKWYYARAACISLAGSIETERESLGKAGSMERFRIVQTPDPNVVARSWEAFVLPVYVMEGCEPFVVTVGRKRGTSNWYGKEFAKTQYAENFYRAHMLVVSMLDLCNEIGILESVNDESNYYETRDLSVLGRELDAYRATAENMGKLFEKAAEELGMEVGGEAVER